MKKITLLLFALTAFSRPVFSQATISVDAPQYDGYWSALIGPNGFTTTAAAATQTSYVYNRSCYLVTQADLARLVETNSVVTHFGFDFYRPGSANVTGQFTLHIEHTTDVTYNKGFTFANIIAGMPVHYAGNLTLPGSPATANSATAGVAVALNSSFTYTGGNIYVAWDWVANGVPSTSYHRYMGTSDATSMGASEMAPLGGPAPVTLQPVLARPAMRFRATNTATNEIGIIMVKAPGSVSKLINPGFDISAIISNNSSVTMNNVPITLTVQGANPYTTTFTVPTIAAGQTLNVGFTPYVPTANGSSTLWVTAPADQYTVNNRAGITQSVNCSDYANNPNIPAAQFNSGGYGYANPAIIATPYLAASTASIFEIKFVSATSANICGVLTDAGGLILATTNTVATTPPNAYTSNLKFNPPYELTANTQYYYGIAQLAPATFPFATAEVLATTYLNLYYTVPIGGGAIGNPQNHMGYLGMQAILGFSNTLVSVAASNTFVCKGQQVTLTASGMDTYTWNTTPPNANPVSPTPNIGSAQNGAVVYNVTGTSTLTGCKSPQASITISVSACVGLASNVDGVEVKLFPNPTVSGKSTITGLVGTNVITVFNALGQVVLTEMVSDENATLDLSNLAAGNYVVKVTDSNNEFRVFKVINQN